MEGLILLGAFALLAILGYPIMSKLDKFLHRVQARPRAPEHPSRLKVATSSPNALPCLSGILKDLTLQHPGTQCSLCVGQEQAVIRSLDAGETDVAIVSTGAQGGPLAQCRQITLPPQSFLIQDGEVGAVSSGESPEDQAVLWRRENSPALALEFIRQLPPTGPRSML